MSFKARLKQAQTAYKKAQARSGMGLSPGNYNVKITKWDIKEASKPNKQTKLPDILVICHLQCITDESKGKKHSKLYNLSRVADDGETIYGLNDLKGDMVTLGTDEKADIDFDKDLPATVGHILSIKVVSAGDKDQYTNTYFQNLLDGGGSDGDVEDDTDPYDDPEDAEEDVEDDEDEEDDLDDDEDDDEDDDLDDEDEDEEDEEEDEEPEPEPVKKKATRKKATRKKAPVKKKAPRKKAAKKVEPDDEDDDFDSFLDN